jgi:hypothetical protein
VICAVCGFFDSADASVSNDALDWGAIRIAQLCGDQCGNSLGLLHGALFKGFANSA